MTGVHVRVRVGDEHYALPVEEITEVGELGDVTPVPGSPPEVIGVRNLRGQVLPVVDLAAILGLDAEAEPDRIVVTAEGERRAGFAVRSVDGVEVLPDAHDEAESEYLYGAALIDGTLVGIVKVDALLDALASPESE